MNGEPLLHLALVFFAAAIGIALLAALIYMAIIVVKIYEKWIGKRGSMSGYVLLWIMIFLELSALSLLLYRIVVVINI